MRALQALALIPLISLLAACGSNDAGAPAKQQQEPASKARLSSLTDPDGHKGPAPARSNEVLAEADRGGPSGTNSAKAPCSLVTRAQAAAIVDEKIAEPQEAKLGPTCIYRYGDDKQMVTLAVQSRPAKTLAREIGRSDAVKVLSKSGYCGQRGQPTLYVPLSTTQVLSVAAPCDTAKAFAVRALKKLAS